MQPFYLRQLFTIQPFRSTQFSTIHSPRNPTWEKPRVRITPNVWSIPRIHQNLTRLLLSFHKSFSKLKTLQYHSRNHILSTPLPLLFILNTIHLSWFWLPVWRLRSWPGTVYDPYAYLFCFYCTPVNKLVPETWLDWALLKNSDCEYDNDQNVAYVKIKQRDAGNRANSF